VVEYIEDFCTKFEVSAFAYFEMFQRGRVDEVVLDVLMVVMGARERTRFRNTSSGALGGNGGIGNTWNLALHSHQ
jgi:hypothetical protein